MPNYKIIENAFKEIKNKRGGGGIDLDKAKKEFASNQEKVKNIFISLNNIFEKLPKFNNFMYFYIEYKNIPPKTKRINFKMPKITKIYDVPQIGARITDKKTFKIYYKLTKEVFLSFKKEIQNIVNIKNISEVRNIDFEFLDKLIIIKSINYDYFLNNKNPVQIRLLPIIEIIKILQEKKLIHQYDKISNTALVYENKIELIQKNFPGIIYDVFNKVSFGVTTIDFNIDDKIKINKNNISEQIIGVIDSGNKLGNPFQSFVVSNHDYRENKENHDYSHGSAVSSLLIAHDEINPTFKDNLGNFKIKHFEVLEPTVNFYHLVKTLKEIIPKNSEIKVWNLSLGGLKTPYSRSISSIGIILDELAFKYNVIFVIAAGNSRLKTAENFSLNMPADSLNGISVGSVTIKKNFVDRAEYSSFGPILHFEKPEVSHFGGPLNYDGSHLMIYSPNLETGEGTSFAAPRISRQVAYWIDQKYTTLQAKAKIISMTNRETKSKKSSAFGWINNTNNFSYDLLGTLVFNNKLPKILPVNLPNQTEKIILSSTHFVKPHFNLGEEYSIYNIELSLAWGKVDAISAHDLVTVSEKESEKHKDFLTETNLRFEHGKYFNSNLKNYSFDTVMKAKEKAAKKLEKNIDDLQLYVVMRRLALYDDLEELIEEGLVISIKGSFKEEDFLSKNEEIIDIFIEEEIDIS